jgi:CDGSH-type Zn-finger protein
MKQNRNLVIVAATVLGLAGLSLAQNEPNEQPTNQAATKMTCGCGHMMDKKVSDSARSAAKDTANGEISNAAREALEREAETAKESLVRWR